MRSGVQYSENTVQFRFLLLHRFKEEEKKYYLLNFAFNKLIDILSMQAAEVGMDVNYRNKYISDNSKTKDAIFELVSPFKKEEKKSTDVETVAPGDTMQALNAVEPEGFKTIGQLVGAVRGLQQVLHDHSDSK